MGFFSSITGGQTTKVPASGYYSMPPEYQQLYKDITNQTQGVAGGDLNVNPFTPLPQTGQETRALGMIDQGLGTPEGFQQNLSMLQNPFDEYVINDLNRQSQGANSLVNQANTQAGQQGSNRSFLGTSDVEQNRLNSIGQFRQSQYNNAVNQALGPLAGLQQQDIKNNLGAGEFQRSLNSQTQQAPYAALAANQGALAGIPTSFGNFGTPEQTIKTGGGLGGLLGGLGSVGNLFSGAGAGASALGYGSTGAGLSSIGTALGFFSDRRLKCDIDYVGLENGHKIYNFRYKRNPADEVGEDKIYTGVMADEVEHIPGAVFEASSGYKAVNYDVIGVNFREFEAA